MRNRSKAYIGCGWSLIGAIAILIIFFFASCKSVEYIEVPVVHTDTLYQSKVVHDSIYQHDSITINEKGDSVWIERWHTKYVDRLRTDTVIRHVRDSIPYPVPEPYPVPAELTWWQQTLTKLGWLMLAVIGAAIIYIIVKLKFKKLW